MPVTLKCSPPNAVLSDRYRTEVRTLMADPIVLDMYASIPADYPLDDLMTVALREYTARGGKNAESIGGVLWALKELRAR